MYAFFQRLAGEDGEIDSEELQDILTTSLCKGMLTTVSPTSTTFFYVLCLDTKLTFSLDACRSMIAMLDVSITTLIILAEINACVECFL